MPNAHLRLYASSAHIFTLPSADSENELVKHCIGAAEDGFMDQEMYRELHDQHTATFARNSVASVLARRLRVGLLGLPLVSSPPKMSKSSPAASNHTLRKTVLVAALAQHCDAQRPPTTLCTASSAHIFTFPGANSEKEVVKHCIGAPEDGFVDQEVYRELHDQHTAQSDHVREKQEEGVVSILARISQGSGPAGGRSSF
ncbi:hypothetical protein CVT26_000626 [Gymnopilus dilepis]|uniref:Uncharacterized protein n=1 Tax=Gymnopilus dilepis TaxID=231916 RepID=A0A409Y2G6_9AGAR|nr:hypothetical protein CVT26_000626 [Gymnopilus dilepis]